MKIVSLAILPTAAVLSFTQPGAAADAPQLVQLLSPASSRRLSPRCAAPETPGVSTRPVDLGER
jgi:hypothetical protein